MQNLNRGKEYPKYERLYVVKINNHPMGENSPNLATLTLSRPSFLLSYKNKRGFQIFDRRSDIH
jgi:hypothetical protein